MITLQQIRHFQKLDFEQEERENYGRVTWNEMFYLTSLYNNESLKKFTPSRFKS